MIEKLHEAWLSRAAAQDFKGARYRNAQLEFYIGAAAFAEIDENKIPALNVCCLLIAVGRDPAKEWRAKNADA